MKKKMLLRTILPLFLLIVLLSSSTVAYAYDGDTVEAEPAGTPKQLVDMPMGFNTFQEAATLSATDNEEGFHFVEAENKAPADRNGMTTKSTTSTTVAKMKIVAVNTNKVSSSGEGTMGHAFLIITNVSSSNITIGGLSGIKPNKSVTVGTWGEKAVLEHEGLWYNFEGCTAANSDVYDTNVALQMSLTSELLSVVNTNIKNGDSYSMLTKNCTHFATGVWNSVCSDKVSSGVPNTTVNSIKSYSTKYISNVSIPFHYAVYYGNPAVKSTVYN